MKHVKLDERRLGEMIAYAVKHPQLPQHSNVVNLQGMRGVMWGSGLAALAASVMLAVSLAPLPYDGGGAVLAVIDNEDVQMISSAVLYDSL